MAIRIGILGYGNLGRGVECAIKQNPDMELKYVFTRRNPESLNIYTKTASVKHIDDILNYKEEIDVLILCILQTDSLFVIGLITKLTVEHDDIC